MTIRDEPSTTSEADTRAIRRKLAQMEGLTREYRPTMDIDVVRDYARSLASSHADAVAALTATVDLLEDMKAASAQAKANAHNEDARLIDRVSNDSVGHILAQESHRIRATIASHLGARR